MGIVFSEMIHIITNNSIESYNILVWLLQRKEFRIREGKGARTRCKTERDGSQKTGDRISSEAGE